MSDEQEKLNKLSAMLGALLGKSKQDVEGLVNPDADALETALKVAKSETLHARMQTLARTVIDDYDLFMKIAGKKVQDKLGGNHLLNLTHPEILRAAEFTDDEITLLSRHSTIHEAAHTLFSSNPALLSQYIKKMGEAGFDKAAVYMLLDMSEDMRVDTKMEKERPGTLDMRKEAVQIAMSDWTFADNDHPYTIMLQSAFYKAATGKDLPGMPKEYTDVVNYVANHLQECSTLTSTEDVVDHCEELSKTLFDNEEIVAMPNPRVKGVTPGLSRLLRGDRRNKAAHAAAQLLHDPMEEKTEEVMDNASTSGEANPDGTFGGSENPDMPIYSTKTDKEVMETYCQGGPHAGCIVRHQRIKIGKVSSAELRKFDGAINSMVSHLSDVLRRAKEVDIMPRKGGKLNPSRIWRLPTLDDPTVFIRRRENYVGGFAIYMLVDGSGSMQPRIPATKAALYVTATALRKLGIAVKIEAFSNQRSAMFMQNLVDWNSPHTLGAFAYNPHGDNRDGLALMYAANELAKRPEYNKILIMVSDGLPECTPDERIAAFGGLCEYTGSNGINDAHDSVHKIRNLGIDVLGIQVKAADSVALENKLVVQQQAIYGQNFLHCMDLVHLPKLISRYVATLIRRQAA